MRIKNILYLALFFMFSLLCVSPGFAEEAGGGSGLGYGLVFTIATIFIGAIGVSQMKYRDKTILIFFAIIGSGTYPTVSAYMANMSLIPKNTVFITASRYNFEVQGEAKVGEPTKVMAMATDVTHAAFIKELGVNLACLPGKGGAKGRDNFRIIVPQQAGAYKIKCVEYCGELHGNMSVDMAGEFVVKP